MNNSKSIQVDANQVSPESIAQIIDDHRQFLEERNQLEFNLDGSGGFIVVGAGLPEIALIPFTNSGSFLEDVVFTAHLDGLVQSQDLSPISSAILASYS